MMSPKQKSFKDGEFGLGSTVSTANGAYCEERLLPQHEATDEVTDPRIPLPETRSPSLIFYVDCAPIVRQRIRILGINPLFLLLLDIPLTRIRGAPTGDNATSNVSWKQHRHKKTSPWLWARSRLFDGLGEAYSD